MLGGIVAIGIAAVIMLNHDRIVAKVRKSDLLAWGFMLSGAAVILMVAHFYLTVGR